jgi:hypothetical protein
MRVDKVNLKQKTGIIKFNNDDEIKLVEEAINKLIKKQERVVQNADRGSNVQREEEKKLEKFKKSKMHVVDMPKIERHNMNIRKQNLKEKIKKKDKNQQGVVGPQSEQQQEVSEEEEDIENTEEFKNIQRMKLEGEGTILTGDVEVSHRDVHVIANSLNELIWDLEQDDLYKKTRRNRNKYETLQNLLKETQEQKAKFQRVTPKPKGYGRLRR